MMSAAQQAKRLRVIDEKVDRVNRRTEAARRTVEAGDAEVERLLAQRQWLASAPVEAGDRPSEADVVEPAEQGGGDAVDSGAGEVPLLDADTASGLAEPVEPVEPHEQPGLPSSPPVEPQVRGSLFDDTHPAARPVDQVV